MPNLFFWQNIPSIHQAPLIREIAKRWSGNVWVVTEAEVSATRIAQGWICPDFSPAKLLVAPSRAERLHLLVRTGSKEDVHIFSGFHAYPETYWTMKQARKSSACLGVFAERGKSGSRLRSFLRYLRYCGHALRWGARLDFLLATGALGVDWYSRCFFPARKLFPFGYFVSSEIAPVTPVSGQNSDIFSLLYVGGLVPWKGVDLLFYALQRLKSVPWILRLVGDGPMRCELETLACTLDIGERIVWEGALANDVARQVMAASDCLVLPSYFDGWGAVVNESLMAGTPAIVSDACGARDLVQAQFLGSAFASRSVTSLESVLRGRMQEGKVTFNQRQKIIDWSNRISSVAGAEYFMKILDSVACDGGRVSPPWEMES